MRNDIMNLVARVACLFLIGTAALAAKGQQMQSPIAAVVAAKQDETQVASTDSSAHGLSSRPATGEQIKWQVIPSGSGKGTSTTYILIGTAGQTAIGFGSSANYDLSHGFWQVFTEDLAPYICGDANADESINVGDAVFLINYIFKGGNPPVPRCVGDANDDDAVNVGDAVYLINYIFKGGNPPMVPCCP